MRFILLLCLLTGLTASARGNEAAIRDLLAFQQAAWNRGDIPAFMTGYWRSEDLRFASGARVVRGWQATLDRYLRTYDTPEKRGQLSFSDLEITLFSPNSAQVFGRWRLDLGTETVGGLFTLTLRKIDGAWKIVADHTSS